MAKYTRRGGRYKIETFQAIKPGQKKNNPWNILANASSPAIPLLLLLCPSTVSIGDVLQYPWMASSQAKAIPDAMRKIKTTTNLQETRGTKKKMMMVMEMSDNGTLNLIYSGRFSSPSSAAIVPGIVKLISRSAQEENRDSNWTIRELKWCLVIGQEEEEFEWCLIKIHKGTEEKLNLLSFSCQKEQEE